MRRFRSISDYLSLGTPPAARVEEPMFGASIVARRKGRGGADLVAADRITVSTLQETLAGMQAGRIPPVFVEGFGDAYQASLPRDMAADLEATPEFKAGVEADRFRIGDKPWWGPPERGHRYIIMLVLSKET
jgi:hypothetical protein